MQKSQAQRLNLLILKTSLSSITYGMSHVTRAGGYRLRLGPEVACADLQIIYRSCCLAFLPLYHLHKMFYGGDLQSGISIALQESKLVACFITGERLYLHQTRVNPLTMLSETR